MLIEDVISTIDSDTKPFWEGTKKKELWIQQCTKCKQYQFYPRIICKNCLADVKWVKSKGIGEIYSYSKVFRVFEPEFKNKVPFIIALVDLVEGPRIMTQLIDIDIKDVKIGLRVKVDFRDEFGEYRLPKFIPT